MKKKHVIGQLCVYVAFLIEYRKSLTLFTASQYAHKYDESNLNNTRHPSNNVSGKGSAKKIPNIPHNVCPQMAPFNRPLIFHKCRMKFRFFIRLHECATENGFKKG